MHILVNRLKSNKDATLSLVSIDNVPECHGLEDEFREIKVDGETRIPAGIYRIGVRCVGGFDRRYAQRFPDMHQGMLQVLDVPGFEYILIHIGNTDEDTAGCLLVGFGELFSPEIKVFNSTSAYKSLYEKVIQAALDGNLTIEYRDNDRVSAPVF